MASENSSVALDVFPPFGGALASVLRDRSATGLPSDVSEALRAVAEAYRRGAGCDASVVEYGLAAALIRWRVEWLDQWSDGCRVPPVGRMGPFLQTYGDGLRELSLHQAVERAPRYVGDTLAELARGYVTVGSRVDRAENWSNGGNPITAADLAKPLADLSATDFDAISKWMVWRTEWRLRRRRRA